MAGAAPLPYPRRATGSLSMSGENGLPVEGGCICGQVRFRVNAPPMLTMACHCRGCQQLTSSAFSLSAVFPSEAFEVIAGEPVVGGKHRDDVRQFYCPNC